MEEDQAGAGEFLNAEQVELFADLAVVALLRFFEPREIVVEIFLVNQTVRRCAGAACFFVALPIRSGDGSQLKRLDF